MDFIFTTVNADQDWGTYIQALRPTGTLCFVGVPPSPVACPRVSAHRRPAHHQRQPHRQPLSGCAKCSTSPRATASRPRPKLFPMAKANEAIEKVKKNKVRYRAVLAN